MKASLLVVLMASTAAADTLESGDVYLIRADGWADEVGCEKWHVDATTHTLTHRTGGGFMRASIAETIVYDENATELTFKEFDRDAGDAVGAEDTNMQLTCKLTASVNRATDSWHVGTAKWFFTKRACTAALKKRERAGATFGCPWPDNFSLFMSSYRQQFEDILTKGGQMFAGPKCTKVKFAANRCSDLAFEPKDDGVQVRATRLYFEKERCESNGRFAAQVARYLPVVATTDDAVLPSCN